MATKRAAGYLRVSQARDGMLADKIYRQEIETYAKAFGYRLAKIYADLDFSGRKGAKQRPAFSEMLERRTHFDLLIVPKLSRFGRSMRDNLEAYDLLEASGVHIAFLDLRIDTSTSGGKLMRNVLTALAEYESDLISERWKDTHRYLAQSGRPNGSIPYGYMYDSSTKQLMPSQPEAGVVREIFRRFVAGETARSIAVDLNRRELPGLAGQERTWQSTHIVRMIDNPTYAGWRQLGRRERRPGELFEGTWEPIVDRELFEEARRLRDATRARTPAEKRLGKGKHLLSGLLFCICGAPMWRNTNRARGRSSYDCSRARVKRRGDCDAGSVQAERAEAYVTKAFLEGVAAPYARHVRDTPKLEDHRTRSPEVDLAEKLADIDRRMERLVGLTLKSGGPTAERAFEKNARALENERSELERAASRQEFEGVAAARRERDLKAFRAKVSNLPEVWEAATLQERHDMLQVAIDRVEVVTTTRPKRLEISWAEWLSGERSSQRRDQSSAG